MTLLTLSNQQRYDIGYRINVTGGLTTDTELS